MVQVVFPAPFPPWFPLRIGDQVLMRSAKLIRGDEAGQARVEARGGILTLQGEEIVSIMVKRFPMQCGQRPAGLGTDADIGGRSAGGSGLRPERRLQEVMVAA